MNASAARPTLRLRSLRRRRVHRQARRRRGFTLIEAALTGVIVGTGVLAMVSAQQAYHIKNNWALRTGTGQLLANELRELMLNLRPYDPAQPLHLGAESNENGKTSPASDPVNVNFWDDIDDFAGVPSGGSWTGVTFKPPINGMGDVIDGMAQWSQHVRVESVLDSELNVEFGATDAQALGSTGMLRVTCTVFYQRDAASARQNVTSLSWIVAR